MSTQQKPVIALTLGDPAGIGAELIARLLARPQATQLANIVLVGDEWLWREGQRVAGVQVATQAVDSFEAVRDRPDTGAPAWLGMETIEPGQVRVARPRPRAGRRCCGCSTPAWTRRVTVTSTPSASRP